MGPGREAPDQGGAGSFPAPVPGTARDPTAASGLLLWPFADICYKGFRTFWWHSGGVLDKSVKRRLKLMRPCLIPEYP